MSDSDAPALEAPSGAAAPRVAAATLYCENCGAATPHRVLRVRPSSDLPRGRVVGVARCRVCRLTHPFDTSPPEQSEVELIVSSGDASERRRLALPRTARLAVGGAVPGAEVRMTIRRLDGPDRRSVPAGRVGEIRAVWAVLDAGASVPVSIVEGRRTRPTVLRVARGTLLSVGQSLSIEQRAHAIVALRSGGRTWKRMGDRFPAEEVGRLYVRRTDRPPAGRSDWRRDRDSSSSWASAISTDSRSRSSPGTRTARRRPRARTAAGGAAVQSDSPA